MALPVIQAASDLPGHEGNPVKVCGYYGIQDLGGYAIKIKTAEGWWKKMRKVAFIKLKDGSFMDLENRPDEEMRVLDGRRVIATGKLIMPANPPAQPIMARPDAAPMLVEINSIQPLPDEKGEKDDMAEQI